MLEKVKIPDCWSLEFCIFDFKNYLIINIEGNVSPFFVLIPKNLKVYKTDTFLICNAAQKDEIDLKRFLGHLKNLIKPFRKKLILKGLGLKGSICSRTIELKLGFSHRVFVDIPNSMSVVIKKNLIILESNDLILLGNFAYKLKQLKFPNAYKGKGIWYKKETRILKTIKKT